MRQLLSLIALSLMACCLEPIPVYSQETGAYLSGKVTDSASGKPLSGCSVFISSTSIGTITRADGSFSLKNIPKGKFELVISAIGYKTDVTEMSGATAPGELKARLRPKVTELSAVTVEPSLKNGWAKYGQEFLENFIGTTENASSCTIRNRQALHFFYSLKNNRLNVFATEPLIIENRALGYTIQYQLESFFIDFNKHVVLYIGYALFKEIPTDRSHLLRQWAGRRRQAYLGSLRQFMRSLYYDCPSLEKFRMRAPLDILNPEKQRIKKVYNPEFSPDQYLKDSLPYYWKIMEQDDYVYKSLSVGTNDIVFSSPDGRRVLYFTGNLGVAYEDLKRDSVDRYAELKLVSSVPIEIEADGGFYPGKELLASGCWARTEKICNLLPFNYQLAEEEDEDHP